MRKILFVLVAVFVLAAPAIARQDVYCTADGNTVTVHYDGNGDLIRAFGLDISVDSGATIESVGSFDPNYYVSPGTYSYNSGTGEVVWGNPIADGGATTSAMTIEMGSLYADNDPCGHTTPPNTSGILLVFDVNCQGAPDCNVTIEGNAARGNVVPETVVADVNYTGCKAVCTVGWAYPACWDWLGQCHGDGNGDNLTVNNSDFFDLKDSYTKTLANDPPVDPENPVAGEYNACADYDRNGVVNNSDFFTLKDNYTLTVDANCPQGDLNELYKP